MKETMNKVINEDLKAEIKKIKQKTLLIWGTKDEETPLSYGIFMNKKIKDSLIYQIEGGTHFVHLEKSKEVNDIIERFISDLND